MRKVLAALEGRFTTFYRLDKKVFFLEVARDNILYQLVRMAALLAGRDAPGARD